MADGLIARVGRWCFRRKWAVLAIWLVGTVVGGLAAGPVFNSLSDSNGPKSFESVQAYDVLQVGSDKGGTVVAVVDKVDPASPAVRDEVRATATALAGISGVTSVVTPFDTGLSAQQAATLIAKDGHGLLIQANLTDKADNESSTLDPIADRMHGLAGKLRADG